MSGYRGARTRQLALVAVGLLLARCASVNKLAVDRPPAEAERPSSVVEGVPSDRDGTSADIERSLAAGDYQRAIDLLEAPYLNDPGDQKSLSSYVRGIEEIKRAADTARGRGNFGQAAVAYRILLDNWAGFSAFESKLAFGQSALQAGIKDCRIGLCGVQSRQDMNSGNYGKALSNYQAALRDYPGDASLKAGYAGVAAEVKAAGAKAFAARDYAMAGKIDALLLRHLESFEGSGSGAGLNRNELVATVNTCRVNLTNRGLEEYRKGNLERAISAWEGLLVFDPENAEILKAVATAKAQLGKIKSMANGGGGGAVGLRPIARRGPKADT